MFTHRFTRRRSPQGDTPAPADAPAAEPGVGAALRTAALARAASLDSDPAPEPVAAPEEVAPAPAAEEPVAAPEAEAAPAPVDPMAVLLAKLEALEALLEGRAAPAEPVAEPAPAPGPIVESPAPANLRFKTIADIDKAESEAESALRHLRANRDGLEFKGADGATVRLTADQVDDEIDRLRDELYRKLPRARADLDLHRAQISAARKAFPTHFDPKHADAREVAALFAQFPSLAGNHALAADILRGRRATAAKPSAVKAAPVAPAPRAPAAPVAAPVSAGAARQEHGIDRERIARGDGGFGHLLRKRL